MFQANNSSAWNGGNGGKSSNSGMEMVMATNNPDLTLAHHANQTQHLARSAITARRKIISRVTAIK